MVWNFIEKCEILNIIEFTSARKMMSVIVRLEDKTIKILSKGADSVIKKRLKDQKSDLINQTMLHVNTFAESGLWTLLLAEWTLDELFYYRWNKDF